MSVQLFRLRNVPEDEAQDIRNLLHANNIDFYETPAGNWGISMPAIWLNDDGRLEEAKQLIKTYQQQRQIEYKNEVERRKRSGEHRSLISELLENPLQAILYTCLAAVILYFSIKPFLHFGE